MGLRGEETLCGSSATPPLCHVTFSQLWASNSPRPFASKGRRFGPWNFFWASLGTSLLLPSPGRGVGAVGAPRRAGCSSSPSPFVPWVGGGGSCPGHGARADLGVGRSLIALSPTSFRPFWRPFLLPRGRGGWGPGGLSGLGRRGPWVPLPLLFGSGAGGGWAGARGPGPPWRWADPVSFFFLQVSSFVASLDWAGPTFVFALGTHSPRR